MGKTFHLLLFVSLLMITNLTAQTDKPAYLLFDTEGKPISYQDMLQELAKADIILFGEYHDNPIAHWLELELTRDLHQLVGKNLILGAEMFESDNQLILNEYLDSLISTTRFEAEARLWPNYKTDYKPLIEYAKENKLPFVATNIPRRYAALVNTKGFEGLNQLSKQALQYIAPLPIAYDSTLQCYKSMLNMPGMKDHAMPNLPKAQAIKDATMAYFISKNYESGKKFIHFHGAYHSNNYEGIYWYLHAPDIRIITITTVNQKSLDSLSEESSNKADFTICVNENMTKTR